MVADSKLSVDIRWMIRRDMPEVLRIEGESFLSPWDEEHFLGVLRQRNCIGMVAEHEEWVLGYMIYALHKNKLELLNLAVCPSHRRRGIGRQLIAEKLQGKLSEQRRNRIELEVNETNLAGQLFFKSCGFRATDVLREWYDDGQDAYAMEYRHGARARRVGGRLAG